MTKRYKHILVPLDGSSLAELALEDAISLAELTQAEITLLQVVPPVEHVIDSDLGYTIFVDEQLRAKVERAHQYLNEICRRMHLKNITVHPAVETGLAGETIIDYAHQQPVDLIVMATHGRSGLQRWVYGSVADKVLRGAGLPILLVRAQPKQEEPVVE